MKNLPSNRASRVSLACEQTCQSRFISLPKPHDNRPFRPFWTFSDCYSNIQANLRRNQPHDDCLACNVRKRPALLGQRMYVHRWLSMTPRIRHCVECPKCRTRYLVGFSPYPNGSYLVPLVTGSSEEFTLYCSCGSPPVLSRWSWRDLKAYVVSNQAHDRGYGPSEEIVPLGREPQNKCQRLVEMRRLLSLDGNEKRRTSE
jgi:hypothetical protein